MKIEIPGPGCIRCHDTHRNILNAAAITTTDTYSLIIVKTFAAITCLTNLIDVKG